MQNAARGSLYAYLGRIGHRYRGISFSWHTQLSGHVYIEGLERVEKKHKDPDYSLIATNGGLFRKDLFSQKIPLLLEHTDSLTMASVFLALSSVAS